MILRYRLNVIAGFLLLALNIVFLNLLLGRAPRVRTDLTEGGVYTLTDTTRELIAGLPGTLRITGYFSPDDKIAPKARPFLPAIRDVLDEYTVVSAGRVRIEYVNPEADSDAEKEARDVFRIKPEIYTFENKRERGVGSYYLAIRVDFGGQSRTIRRADFLPEVFDFREGTFTFRLRNLEYVLTKTIREVLASYRGETSVFARTREPVAVRGLLSAKGLPAGHEVLREHLESVFKDLKTEGGDRFTSEITDPETLSRSDLQKLGREGLRIYQYPNEELTAILEFFCDLRISVGDRAVFSGLFRPSEPFSAADIRARIDAALNRIIPGAVKTIGVATFPDASRQDPRMGPRDTHAAVKGLLESEYNVEAVNLLDEKPSIPANVDVLVLFRPANLSEAAVYAVDQFVMSGGRLVMALESFELAATSWQPWAARKVVSGLTDWLGHIGVELDSSVVLDRQNVKVPFEIPDVPREDRPYPYFVVVDPSGMDASHLITQDRELLQLAWASPLRLREDRLGGIEHTVLVRSSAESWTEASPTAFDPRVAYAEPVTKTPSTLAVALSGRFRSWFADRPVPGTPSLKEAESRPESAPASAPAETAPASRPEDVRKGTLRESEKDTRIVVIGDSDFVGDLIYDYSERTSQTYSHFRENFEFFLNVLDWTLADEALVKIRSRGRSVRPLETCEDGERRMITLVNYLVPAAATVLLGIGWAFWRANRRPMTLDPRR